MAAKLEAEVVGRQFHRGSGDRPYVSVPTYPRFEGLTLEVSGEGGLGLLLFGLGVCLGGRREGGRGRPVVCCGGDMPEADRESEVAVLGCVCRRLERQRVCCVVPDDVFHV